MINQVDLIKAYYKFIKGKRKRKDVQEFILNAEYELCNLFQEIHQQKYRHGEYEHFKIFDPKLREIDKATIKDRIVHQLVYDYLVTIYDKTFYFHSYAARKGGGTHRAINNFYKILKLNSCDFIRNIFILKCDIKKFFASINKNILLSTIKQKVFDDEYLYLIQEIVYSFNPQSTGIPLGNLTSQIFANIYLNELDRFVKHGSRVKHYIRYMDDFVIIGHKEQELRNFAVKINNFLSNKLHLKLHSDKIIIRKISNGIDFLGYTQLPGWRILRATTRKRIFRKIEIKNQNLKNGKITEKSFDQTIQSYLGVLKHCSSFKLKQKIFDLINSL